MERLEKERKVKEEEERKEKEETERKRRWKGGEGKSGKERVGEEQRQQLAGESLEDYDYNDGDEKEDEMEPMRVKPKLPPKKKGQPPSHLRRLLHHPSPHRTNESNNTARNQLYPETSVEQQTKRRTATYC